MDKVCKRTAQKILAVYEMHERVSWGGRDDPEHCSMPFDCYGYPCCDPLITGTIKVCV